MSTDKFFARQSYLDIFYKRCLGLKDGYRQNLALVGDEMIGKTTLIFRFLDKFFDSRLLTVYLEIRPEPLSSFVKRFIAVLLYNFLANSGIPLKEDLDFLIKKSAKYIPKTAEQINAILAALKRKKSSNLFTDLLSLSELLYKESGKSCILILDEFHNLEALKLKNLYRDWSKLLLAQKHTMYIITSSLKYKAKTILSKDLSLLFGNFELVTLEPFDIQTCERYLEEKLLALKLNSEAKNFIVHFTGGFPFYLGVITDGLLKETRNGLLQVLEDLLLDPCGLLNQRFSNYIKRFDGLANSEEFIFILNLIAGGRNKINDIVHLLQKQKRDIIPRINQLLELDTINRSGDFLKINDRVFGFWIRYVHQQKLSSLNFDLQNQKERFRQNLENLIQEFLLCARKPLIERCSELLRLFEDEVMQLETKKIRLNHFREIKHLEFKNPKLKDALIGRSQDGSWIVAFKKEQLIEEDIAEFARECKKYQQNKLQRKIIITLSSIDDNTRLRALEEKIWTWDINNLNQILDLYSQPWIVA